MRPGRAIGAVLDRQRGALFPWIPVCLGAGIGLYLGLPDEPAPILWPVLALAWLGLVVVVLRDRLRRPLLIALLALLGGFGLAAIRTHSVAAPVLEARYYGPVEGRIVAVDRSVSDRPRLTLDRVVLTGVDLWQTPRRVRVSLHGAAAEGAAGGRVWVPGETVVLTGHLSPPAGAVEPGGFDFRRHAWFLRLGAVGYTRTPVLLAAPAEGGAVLFVHRLRMRLSEAVRALLPGRAGAFAAAVTTGDRSAMDRETLEALRLSNLAHLLAISGLHMGLLTAFVFGAVRAGLALVPAAALRLPGHKIGALAALAAGAAYLALSGGNVATERAFIMVAVVFAAVLLDRRAFTLRAVAVAAMIVLALRPEALAGPGFQMSFAATTALIAVFGWVRNVERARAPWQRWLMALVLSSAVAGLATAPFAAAHFNRLPHYGLLANMLSVPLMGAVVMPGAVLAAVLAPLGLGWIGLAVMRPPIEWILLVAERVAALPGAVSHVPAPPGAVLPLIALGALWVILWQGRARAAGLVLVAAGGLLWSGVERPAVLVSASGGLVGVLTEEGRALSKPRGEGFAARSWLENDGDGAGQAEAHARAGFAGGAGLLRFRIGELEAAHLSGRGAAGRLAEACRSADLVILSGTAPETAPQEVTCRLIDRAVLAETGALAIRPAADGLRIAPARGPGRRPWSGGAGGL